MRGKDLVSLNDLTPEELRRVLDLSHEVKRHPARYRSALADKALAMILQKPSIRTRISFQVGMTQLGGEGMVISSAELQLGRGETIADTARVLSRYVDGILARVHAHAEVETLAEYADVPVLNGLSDLLHPCHAISDYFTMEEQFGYLKGLPISYVGDGNNMCNSLARGAAKLGAHLTIGTPRGYEPDAGVIAEAKAEAVQNGGRIEVISDPAAAVAGKKVVYTDVWTSMGREAEEQQRRVDLQAFQVNTELFSKADFDAVFMHCLPAHRFEEVTDEVADHERSLIFDQAENRLHAQKALLVLLLG